jgi:hypothetical protein
MDLAIGWSVGSVAVGGIGGISALPLSTMSTKGDYARAKGEHAYFFFGLFLDYYLDPHLGTHFGGGIGFAGPGVKEPSGGTPADSKSAFGFGAYLTGGYDFWVNDQWSIGGSARLMYVPGKDEYGVSHSAIIPGLLVSLLYN